MRYIQVISPDLNQETAAGWCLMFAQNSYGAPVMHASATEAANATKLRHYSRALPNVSVPVWFDHWGSYGSYGNTYANWGHVVNWVPGRGFLSSPATGFGQLWLSSLESVERTFNAKYRFWSLDINTLQVAKATPNPPTDRSRPVAYISGWKSAGNSKNKQIISTPKVFLHVRDNRDNSITTSEKQGSKLVTGMVLITGTLHVTGKPGARLTFGAVRGKWGDSKWHSETFIESVSATLDSAGVAKIALPVSNRIPKGERLRFYVTPESGAGKLTVERFSWKGYEWV